MSSTTQYTTFSDLYTGLINAVRLTAGVTATETQAKRAINVGLQDMHLGLDHKFPWAERQAILRTQDDYTTGTVTITRGSSTLTGVDTLWNTNNDFGVKNARVNGKIVIAGSRTPYKVQAVGSDTGITLTTPFTETSVSAASYSYFEDEYDLASDFLRPIDIRKFSVLPRVDLIPRSEARMRHPTNAIPNRPFEACIVDYAPSGNTTPIRRIQLFPPPNDFYQLPYTYITSSLAVSALGVGATGMSADSDEPIVPLRYRYAILLHALYHWYRDKKDDTRSAEAKGEYTDLMSRVIMDHDFSSERPRMAPRVGGYKRAAKNPYSAGTRRFDRGRFDGMGE